MAEGLQIDPVSEDATNIAFDLIDGTKTFLLEASYPPPERDTMWASSADTEGDALVQTRFRNRVITVKVRVVGSTASALQTTLGQMQQKVGKLVREGGTLKRTAPSTTTIVFDVLGASLDIPIDRRHLNLNRAEVTFSFECKPFGRGTPVVGSAHSQTTLPVLVFTETGVKGDVPALGQLVVNEDQGADQWWLTWGVQSRYYSAAATAEVFYQAEDLTPLGGAANNAGPSGASGAGGNKVVRSGALTTSPVAILSTQASGGGAHLTHIGTFRVFARVQMPNTDAGDLSLAFEWAQGDFANKATNATVTLDADEWNARWRLVDLGQVNITRTLVGTQRWEGRIIASSTITGDTIDVDYLMFIPVSEGTGEVSALPPVESPTALSGSDGFAQAAGNLNGKTATTGGNWATSGAATDLATSGSGLVSRATTLDGSGRVAILGTTTFTDAGVQIDTYHNTKGGAESGVLARYVDSSNYVRLGVAMWPTLSTWTVQVVVGGSAVVVPRTGPAIPDAYQTIRFVVADDGRFWGWGFNQGSPPGDPIISGWHVELATGGVLASGKSGFTDYNPNAAAVTRTYDTYAAWVPKIDAAMYASQSLQIRHDGVIREDSAGAVYAPVSDYQGDYLTVPPEGREARTSRFIVKASRGNLEDSADSNIDDISATLTYTPRFLVVPES